MSRLLNRELGVRTASGVVFVAVMAGGILWSPYSLLVLMLVVGAGCLFEFYRLAGLRGVEAQLGYGQFLGLAAVGLGFSVAMGTIGPVWLLALVPAAFVVFATELYRDRPTPIENIAVTLAGVLYTAAPLALLFPLGIEARGDLILYRPLVVLCLVALVWTNDVGAYLVGSLVGRHKLFERISPKKSWEGFAGGMVIAMGVALLMGRWLGGSPAAWCGLGAVVAVAGVLGDLAESLFKRSVGVKDSGRMMPGHGGFLDRFDALLVAAPFAVCYCIVFGI